MPNWCENELKVRGHPDEIHRFKGAMQGTDWQGKHTVLSEDALIPYPDKYRQADETASAWNERVSKALTGLEGEQRQQAYEKFVEEHGQQPADGYNAGGYEWCIQNWGTKWGFVEPILADEFNNGNDTAELLYVFDSAWSPPEPLVRKMGELFPGLVFELRYFEGGVGFNGMLCIERGKEVFDECGAYFGDRGG